MQKSIQQIVQEKYGAVAVSDLSSRDAGVHSVAEAFGYSAEELASIPAEANMGLSCGNPTATAALKAGEVVVDLGSGGGLDVFLAAKKVGPAGRAIGIDMTPEMIDRAQANALRQGLENVEFYLASIDKTPLADDSADCVISNCVINLAPDKNAVLREIYRILKPGGRVAVSDIALKKALPPEVGQDLLAYVGCIAGAIPISDYVSGLKAAGFEAVEVIDAGKDLNAYSQAEGHGGCCSPVMQTPALAESDCCAPAPTSSEVCCIPHAESALEPRCCTPASSSSSLFPMLEDAPEESTLHGALAALLRKYNVNDYAASVQVYAVKPA